MSGYLLDANVLIALAWPAHQYHARVQEWFKARAQQGWATTAFTQAAFVRIVSQPAFSAGTGTQAIGPREAAELLTPSLAHRHHSFLAQDMQIAEVISYCTGGLIGHRQVTDAYLLALALKSKRKLVTFDSGLKELLATGREREVHIEVIG